MKVKIARIYMMESEHHLKEVLKILHDEIKVQHVTVFRGIEGFEDGGKVHSSEILSLSLNLPLVVEFFDTSEKAQEAAKKIKNIVEPCHIVIIEGSVEN